MNFNSFTKDFKLCLVPNINGTAGKDSSTTEIYANFDFYPNGVDITVTNNLVVWKVDSIANTILVRNKPQVKPSVTPECITISNTASGIASGTLIE